MKEKKEAPQTPASTGDNYITIGQKPDNPINFEVINKWADKYGITNQEEKRIFEKGWVTAIMSQTPIQSFREAK